MRKICVIITARPSYSRIKSALIEMKNHPKIDLQLIVTSSAVLERYGKVVDVMKSDGFSINEEIFSVIEGGDLSHSVKDVGMCLIELSSALKRLKPDAVVTIADRYETIANAISASYMNIPLIHIQGGEITGSIDESVRHAITKLSHLHFASTVKSRNNIISNLPKRRFKSVLKIKKSNDAKIPRKIPNPPIRGIGILFCFLKSTKSNKLLFRAKLFIKGNEIDDTKRAIKKQ